MLGRLLYRNFLLVYRVSQWTRDRFTPAGALILGGAVGAGIFGIDTRQTLAFQVFSITASLLLLAMLSVFTFRGNFRIRRKLPDFGTVGEPVNYKILVENTGRQRQRELLLIDVLESHLPAYSEFKTTMDPDDRKRNWYDRKIGYPRLMGIIQKKRGGSISPVAMDDLPPDQEVEFNACLFPVRRGYIHFTRSRVARPDPLGIYRAIKSKINTDSLLILPKRYRVPVINLTGTRKYQKGGLSMAGSVGDSREFISLRDYRPGDPLRDIHWRSYAKLGHPVVKEFHDEFYVRQGLLLDTFIEDNSESIFEEAVSVAASLTVSLNTQDALLDLMFIGAEAYRFTAGRGLGKTENMLEILACVTPCRDRSFSSLETMLSGYLTDTSGLICVLQNWDNKRRNLIRFIRSRKIPVLVFQIAEDGKPGLDVSPADIDPDCFITLKAGQIQDQLDHIKIPDEIK